MDCGYTSHHDIHSSSNKHSQEKRKVKQSPAARVTRALRTYSTDSAPVTRTDRNSSDSTDSRNPRPRCPPHPHTAHTASSPPTPHVHTTHSHSHSSPHRESTLPPLPATPTAVYASHHHASLTSHTRRNQLSSSFHTPTEHTHVRRVKRVDSPSFFALSRSVGVLLGAFVVGAFTERVFIVGAFTERVNRLLLLHGNGCGKR